MRLVQDRNGLASDAFFVTPTVVHSGFSKKNSPHIMSYAAEQSGLIEENLFNEALKRANSFLYLTSLI